MTGGGKKPKGPEPIAPAARIEMPGEVDDAKKKVRRRGGGRSSNILAGRMMSQRQGAGLKQILG